MFTPTMPNGARSKCRTVCRMYQFVFPNVIWSFEHFKKFQRFNWFQRLLYQCDWCGMFSTVSPHLCPTATRNHSKPHLTKLVYRISFLQSQMLAPTRKFLFSSAQYFQQRRYFSNILIGPFQAPGRQGTISWESMSLIWNWRCIYTFENTVSKHEKTQYLWIHFIIYWFLSSLFLKRW